MKDIQSIGINLEGFNSCLSRHLACHPVANEDIQSTGLSPVGFILSLETGTCYAVSNATIIQCRRCELQSGQTTKSEAVDRALEQVLVGRCVLDGLLSWPSPAFTVVELVGFLYNHVKQMSTVHGPCFG